MPGAELGEGLVVSRAGGSPSAARPGRCSVIRTTSRRLGGARPLDVANRRARRVWVLHHRHLAGQLREQPHAAADDVVEVDGAVEERRIARFSAALIGLTVVSRSTKSR